MKLECFATNPESLTPVIVPGRPQRDWMDDFDERHPYRCLPLTMANTTGWELLCPMGFSASWNGGANQADISVTPQHPRQLEVHDFATSHFSGGVLTMHTGYLFRTPPGWSMWVMGPPNHVKDGIQPLIGLVETDWLPFPFTMNWHFTRPGRVRFEKGEPFCFLTLMQDKSLEQFEVEHRSLESEPAFKAEFDAWVTQRAAFNKNIFAGDPETIKAAWQRFYFKGQGPGGDGTQADGHVRRRRLQTPKPEE